MLREDLTFFNLQKAKKVRDTVQRPMLPVRIWRFYRDGFREMTTGRWLWLLIIVKLAIIFLVFKLLFFPDILKRDYDDDASRASAVRRSMLDPQRNR